VVGASNRLPEDDALEALFDRFLLRVRCDNVSPEELPNVLAASWQLDFGPEEDGATVSIAAPKGTVATPGGYASPGCIYNAMAFWLACACTYDACGYDRANPQPMTEVLRAMAAGYTQALYHQHAQPVRRHLWLSPGPAKRCQDLPF